VTTPPRWETLFHLRSIFLEPLSNLLVSKVFETAHRNVVLQTRYRRKMKKMSIKGKRFAMPLILLFLAIGSAAAVAYVILQFSINATVENYPKVTFWKWTDGAGKVNTFDYPVNIFANVKTIDENATHGIFNDDTVQHQCSLRVGALTNPTNIASLYIKVYNSTSTILEKEWTSFASLPTAWESFTTAAGKKYSIWIEITASASPSGYSTFTMELKVENP